MQTTVPSSRPIVRIKVHPSASDGTRAITLVFSPEMQRIFQLTDQAFQDHLNRVEKATGTEIEVMQGSKGPFVACEGRRALLAQELLVELIGLLGFQAQIEFTSQRPRLAP